VVTRTQPGLAGDLRMVRRMAIPIFRAAHIGIDQGAIDLAVAAASVGDLFHCGIFQNLVAPGEHQLKLRYGPVSEPSGRI
jgi:hypothetical protein